MRRAIVGLLLLLAACSSGHGAKRLAQAPPSTIEVTTTTAASSPTPTVEPSTTAAPTTTTTTVSVAAAASRLTEIETAIRNPATPIAESIRLGQEQQMLYRSLSADPAERVADVVAAVPADVRPDVQANANAVRELRAIPVKLRDTPPDWRIVAAAPADELLAAYHEAATAEGVPWTVLAAIHLVETRLGRIRGTSSAGAQGPMQFLPSTWAKYGNGGDINSTEDSLLAAARYLRANGAPDRLDSALYAYNHSSHYVTAVRAIASVLDADQRAFSGYYGWKVIYRTTHGDVVLDEGYGR